MFSSTADPSQVKVQWLAYSQDPAAFVRDCVYIYDATGQDWIRFELFTQTETLAAVAAGRRAGDP